MHLERDRAEIGQPALGVLEVHYLFAVEPRRVMRGISGDAGAERVPTGAPQRAGGAFAENEAADVERRGQRLAPDTAHGAAGIEVDHDLIGGALGGGAEKKPAVAVPFVGGLERDLDVAE